MKSAEYYRLQNEAHERALKAAKPRRIPFKVSKSTTAIAKGYVVLIVIGKGTPHLLRLHRGCATWVSTGRPGTIFRTRANAATAIKAYETRFSHSCKLTYHAIIPIGEVAYYHG